MNNKNLVRQPPVSPPVIENQPLSNPSSNSKRNLIVIIVVTFLVLVGSLGGYFLGVNKNKTTSSNTPQDVTPTSVNNFPSTTNTNDNSQVLPTIVKIPFVRNGNVYLFENGQETLIASSTQKSSFDARYDNAYPFLSPNGKYLTYIQFAGSGGLSPQGVLKIYNIDTKETKTTNYKTQYVQWNSFNQLQFQTETYVDASSGQGTDPTQSKISFIVLDPQSQQEIVTDTMSLDERDKSGIGGFPLFSNKKSIEFKNNSYYLADKKNNTEKLLFAKGDIYQFSGWSPNGVYAVFLGAKQNPYKPFWISVNSNDPNLTQTEIKVKDMAGGAGGDVSTGLKWYFNEGFVIYCMQDIFFVDGREPLELTHTGGGGCHNEEGFVATSPNGEYSFVKFDDRFELYTKSGSKKVINESTPIQKSRGTPKNLVWVNNDYMIIYENTFGGESITKKPRVFLFDRNDNLIKPVIDDAYLSTFAVGIP